MKKKLLSPRGYLSWTQVAMYESSPEKYRQTYILGKANDFENDFMTLGKKVSTALETGEKTGDLVTDIILEQVVKYKYREYEMTQIFTCPAGEITILGKLDTFNDIPLRFREYKTGSVKWNLKKAQEHGQNLHYATLIWLKTGKISEGHLDWMPTKRENDGEVRFTGEPIQSYKLVITLTDILKYMARVSKVAIEIDKLYKKELGIK